MLWICIIKHVSNRVLKINTTIYVLIARLRNSGTTRYFEHRCMLLIRCGVDVNAKATVGIGRTRAPLKVAVDNEHITIQMTLKKSGATL